MAWTNTQKAVAVRACKAAGLPDEHRKLILRQLPNAFFNLAGQKVADPTSTSARLTNADFEFFMGLIERQARGQVKLPGTGGRSYSAGYWTGKAEDRGQRMRHRVGRLVALLEAKSLLAPDGKGLAAWINKCIRPDGARLDQLDMVELGKLLNGLKSYAHRHGLAVDDKEVNSNAATANG